MKHTLQTVRDRETGEETFLYDGRSVSQREFEKIMDKYLPTYAGGEIINMRNVYVITWHYEEE